MLNIKMSTPTTMVMGELQTSHIENVIYSGMHNYLGKMVRGQQYRIICYIICIIYMKGYFIL